MLVIIGASHKGYLDADLNEMHDVVVVDAPTILRKSTRTLREPSRR